MSLHTPASRSRPRAAAAVAAARCPVRSVALLALLFGAGALAPFATATAAQLAFVTSSTGFGILGDWPEAGGNTGLAAGDAICVARATAAHLPDPASFVAWLSDTNDDAYCRVHGFGGKKSANCGQASLPTGAGPWQRTDGTPFMGVLDQITTTEAVYTPMNVDEFGHEISREAIYTGTLRDGTAGARNCGNWTTDAFGEVDIGQTTDTYPQWTEYAGYSFCRVAPRRIACLQKGAGTGFTPLPHPRKQAFVTSTTVSGDLSSSPLAAGNTGLAAGDAICRNVAASAGLEDAQSYKVYLSFVSDPATHFDNDGPWDRVDGVRFADSFQQMASGVHAPLNITEAGNLLNGQFAWNGFYADGRPAFQNCSDWTSGAQLSDGWAAVLTRTGPLWPPSYDGSVACNYQGALLCLSDVDRIFRNGLD